MGTALVMVNAVNGGVLSKEQKTFNRLTAKIAKLRTQLVEWKAVHASARQTHAGEIVPLLDKYWQGRAELLQLLVNSVTSYKLTKKEKKGLSESILALAEALLAEDDCGDEEQVDMVKAIYQQFGGNDFDENREAMHAEMRQQMEEMFDVNLEDIDFSDPDVMMRQLMGKIEEQFHANKAQAQGGAKGSAKGSASGPDGATYAEYPGQAPQPRKKTAKQLAKEERERAFEAQANQSLREVYRKLASSLHPDREPDPAERARKTELMQKLNKAYEDKDLLAMLELQLQIEQLDAAALAAMSAERLGYFNKVLKEQVAELEQEVDTLRAELYYNLGYPPDCGLPTMPKQVTQKLQVDVHTYQVRLAKLELDKKNFESFEAFKAAFRR